MSVKLLIGASGTGKSKKIFDFVVEEAKKDIRQQYFVIVPDQFTMQTQMDMVRASGCDGIMNIDVLSFSRLAHRIFEETNMGNLPVLDDMGKSLVIRRLANGMKEDIPTLSGNLDKDGYIHEIKSSISEFMQYGITVENLDEMIVNCGSRGMLAGKLRDLQTVYKAFLEYIDGDFMTREESMDVLARALGKSEIIKDSVCIFDGFTGFTPVQMKVLKVLFGLCRQVFITLTVDNVDQNMSEEKLFAFTNKSYWNIVEAAKGYDVETEVLSGNKRHQDKNDLLFMENNLFRYPVKEYEEKPENIHIYAAKDIASEVRETARAIRRLVEEKKIQYRDIAIITGDLSGYEYEIIQNSNKYDIPVYIDKTKRIELNPFVEYIKASIEVLEKDYSIDSVFRVLRSGMTDLEPEETDYFENFCLAHGIRGKAKYEHYFESGKEDDDTRVNRCREYVNSIMEPFTNRNIGRSNKISVRAFIEALYEYITRNDSYTKIKAFSNRFKAEGDYSLKKEYDQVYENVIRLLEQIYELFSEETVDAREFGELIDAGLGEIRIGMIPQSVDRVIVGDIQRSRLKPVKYLFFLGMNEGYIPKADLKGSILSQTDRENLKKTDYELSPTARDKMYIERFYLYANLTKPSDGLFMSYSALNGDGDSMTPAYIIPMFLRMYPKMEKKIDTGIETIETIYTLDELKNRVADLIRKVCEDDVISGDNLEELSKCIAVFNDMGLDGRTEFVNTLIDNSFYVYKDVRLNGKITGELYSDNMTVSVSKVEKFAQCAYAYFLKYGLSLQERKEFGFDVSDMGTIFHDTLDAFSKELEARKLTWFDFSEEDAQAIIDVCLDNSDIKNDAKLKINNTSKYIYGRMKKALYKAVSTLGYQIRKGEFNVEATENRIKREMELDVVNEASGNNETITLTGSVDRVDTRITPDKIYVKIIDYKTNGKDFSLVNFYNGLQLQLVVYMGEVLKDVEKKYKKEAVPAGILYYKLNDDTVEITEGDNIQDKIRKSLCTQGYVNCDDDILYKMDKDMESESDVIPVKLNKNGSFSANSKILTTEEMQLLNAYADKRIRDSVEEIIGGVATKNPVKMDNRKDSCTYCSYKSVCGFDRKIEGYSMRSLPDKKKDEEVLEDIRVALTKGGVQ